MSNSSRFKEECNKHAKAIKSQKRSVASIYNSGSDLAIAKSKPQTKTTVERERVPPRPASKPIAKTEALRPSSKSLQSKIPQPTKVVAASKPSALSYQDEHAHDIDGRDADDPQCATAYVKDIYQYFKTQEHRAVVGPYMEKQNNLNETMRAILIDWLVEVHRKFKLVPETLHLTVNIIDRYLDKKTEVARKKLQLVGVTALLIASKYEDIFPPELCDLVYVCDKAYPKREVRVQGSLSMIK